MVEDKNSFMIDCQGKVLYLSAFSVSRDERKTAVFG